MNVYFKCVLYFLIFFGIEGFLLPNLFSSESDYGVLLGLMIAVLFVPISYYYIKWSFEK